MLDIEAIDAHSLSASHLDLEAIEDHRALLVRMKPDGRSCFTLDLLRELSSVGVSTQAGVFGAPDFWVLASSVPGVFNYGGDLELFAKAIHERDHRTLTGYGRICVDLVHQNRTGLGLPLTTVSLIQGDALGGGAEAALSSQVIVAERGCKIGFPEILFNLFPGMGAFHLVADKLGHRAAQRMLLEGTFYTTDEFHELGLVDVLVDQGDGEAALCDYMASARATSNGRHGLARVAARSSAADYETLMATVDTWVERALTLEEDNLRLIDHLVARQAVKAEADSDDTQDSPGVSPAVEVEADSDDTQDSPGVSPAVEVEA